MNDAVPSLDGQAILDEKVIEKTFLNNTSVMEDTFQQNKSYLAGLPEGRIIIVTYYSQNAPITDIQSHTADMTMKPKDDVHVSWSEIRNFEIRLGSEFNYEYQDTEVTSVITGEGIVLPGFVPRIGDIFLYMMRNDKIGVFNLTNVTRLALGQETYHRINFTMEEFLDQTLRDRLRRQSTTYYFDKTKFLIGNNAYLNTEGWVQQKELRHIRREIIVNYMDRFYDQEFSSFMSPDGIFDPYIVEYWNKKVSISDCRQRPIQLLISVQNYHKTIWSVLTMNPIKNLKNVASDYNTSTMVSTFWGVNITALLGHKFITVGNEPSHNCGVGYLSDGTPVAIGTSLYTSNMHGTQFDEAIKQHAEKAWDIARHAFYGNHLPHQKCAPHQHPIDIPHECDPGECHICEWQDKHEHHPHHRRPPYPVVSTEELYEIWKKLRHPFHPPHDHHHEWLKAQFRGYVQWYRQQHPGTLSAKELEDLWRREAHIPPSKQLTEQEQEALSTYIRSYRAKYPPILTDREIEFCWRHENHIPLEEELTEDGLSTLQIVIDVYRHNHGKVPSDVIYADIDLGQPYIQEEIDNLRIMQDRPQLEVPEEKLPDVPYIFRPHHPHPYQHLHCHSVCHLTCGSHVCSDATQKKEQVPTYVLSPEFYLGSAAMDPFERILYQVITNQEFKVADILALVSQYLDWDNEYAFYHHLLSIYLIDKALHWLRFHS